MRRLVDPDSLGFLITDLSRMIRAEMDRRVAEAGLGVTAGEARTLNHAARAGSVRQNVLAERMGVEAMTLSAYLDRLEARGLVTRRVDPADRRAKLVELTPAAEEVLAATSSIAAEIRAEAARAIPPEQWKLLVDLLKTMRANLSQARSSASRNEAGHAS
jgi:MarR family transcriptional regulator, transcriptional regulator for hemolysin